MQRRRVNAYNSQSRYENDKSEHLNSIVIYYNSTVNFTVELSASVPV